MASNFFSTVFITTVFIFSTTSSLSIAHSGGLNSSGCHNNRKTGGYHCHRSSYTPKKTYKPYKTPNKSNQSIKKSTSSTKTLPSNSVSLIDILTTQIYLDLLGYDVGKPDGILGTKTKSAIEQYQRSGGLSVDGKITNSLISHLKRRLD